MDNLKIINKLQKIVSNKPHEYQAVEDLFEMLRIYEQEDFDKSHEWNKQVRKIAPSQVRNSNLSLDTREKFYFLNKKSLLFDSKTDFDAYMQYIEYDREPEKRFYLPRRKQIFPIVQALQDLEDDKLDLLTISTPPGVGKLIADETPVLTTKGWKNHGDLKVGDKVFNHQGKVVKVTHIFPKHYANYQVEFTNGEIIKCHENHEWVVWDRNSKQKRIMSVRNLLKHKLTSGKIGKRGGRYVFQLPLVEPIKGEKKKLAVDPYVLGAWLGDGTINKPAITVGTTDKVIIDEVVRRGYAISSTQIHPESKCPSVYFKNLRKDLQKIDMCYSRRNAHKRIPEEYLTASLEQRLDLLSGLLDTDGTLNGRKYNFSTTSPEIRDGVLALLNTMGWRCYYSTYPPRTPTSGIKGKKEVYTIGFNPSLEVPCKVKRKQLVDFSKQRRISIKNITPIEPTSGNCIEVEGGIYLVGKQMIPTHNSTLGIFFLTWVMGKYPASCNLASAHSGMLTNSFYDGALSTITDPEYLWADVFPGISIVGTNSKEGTIDLEKRKRFKTLTCRSIDGSLTGATRCEKYLYADDLVSGIEEAMSKDRLDKLWEKYTNDLKSRKKLGCKEIHIATRWSVHDVIGRLERQYDGDSRARFLSFPALGENEESNFDYDYGVGFDTKYFWDMRESLDDVSWRCLFMNEPIEREGLLYHEDDLRRYFELPKEEPDAVIAVCDTKDKGKDYAFLPVAYVYGQDYYIEDCVCDNALPEIVDARLTDILVRHKVKMCRFESNSAGGRIAEKIQSDVKDRGGITHITTKYTTQNKETKIIVNSPWVKEHCLFKHSSGYQKSSDYGRMINFLCMWTMAGKNKHDDVPDGMAMLAEYAQSLDGAKVEVFQRPF